MRIISNLSYRNLYDFGLKHARGDSQSPPSDELYPLNSGQTLSPRTTSVRYESGAIGLQRGDMMDTLGSHHLESRDGNITIVFFGKESIIDFAKHLFSKESSDYWDRPCDKTNKPNLEDPIELQNQIVEIFGLDLFERSVFSLSCEVVNKVSHISDLCSLDDSMAVFVFGNLEGSTIDGLSAIQSRAPSSLLVDFTPTHEPELGRLSPGIKVNETLLMIDFIINCEDVDLELSFSENYPASDKISLSCSNDKICAQIKGLFTEQKKVEKSFDRNKRPSVYEDWREDRKNFTHWLEDLKKELNCLNDQSVSVQNSFRRLAAYWEQRGKHHKFRVENENDIKRLELNLEDNFDNVDKAAPKLKVEYGPKPGSNHNRFHGTLTDFKDRRKLVAFTEFNEWVEADKKLRCYNYNPEFWEPLFELYSLNLSTTKIEMPDGANLKIQFWIKPTNVEKINAMNLKHRIRRSFVKYDQLGGIIS